MSQPLPKRRGVRLRWVCASASGILSALGLTRRTPPISTMVRSCVLLDALSALPPAILLHRPLTTALWWEYFSRPHAHEACSIPTFSMPSIHNPIAAKSPVYIPFVLQSHRQRPLMCDINPGHVLQTHPRSQPLAAQPKHRCDRVFRRQYFNRQRWRLAPFPILPHAIHQRPFPPQSS